VRHQLSQRMRLMTRVDNRGAECPSFEKGSVTRTQARALIHLIGPPTLQSRRSNYLIERINFFVDA
jgi:hypothetical protein